MGQIFTLRFIAAIVAVFALFALLIVLVAGTESITDREDDEIIERHVQLVAVIDAADLDDFDMVDGRVVGDGRLSLSDDRSAHLVEGTYGSSNCDPTMRRCAIVAEVLGDAVLWFTIEELGPNETVVMPAIDVLDRDEALLVNGWRVGYADRLDRRCGREFGSFREWRAELGDEFVSIYSIEDDELIAVVCT
jgi:hypothetical protein